MYPANKQSLTRTEGTVIISNNTRAEWFGDCMRRGYLSTAIDGVGIRKQRKEEALGFGTIVHAGLASYYSGAGDVEIADAIKASVDKDLNFEQMNFEEKNLWTANTDWAQRLLRAYRPWAKENDNFSVMQIETEGMVEVGDMCWKCGNPYVGGQESDKCQAFVGNKPCASTIHYMVFRVDMTVNQNSKVGVYDHKTAKSASDLFLRSWHYSPQLIWYSYGYGKALGTKVNFYKANIIKKLKTVGKPEQVEKRCPDCKNGSKKKITCETCHFTGKVEKEEIVQPFLREGPLGLDEKNVERVIRSRISLFNTIEKEFEKFEAGDKDEAFPMNPKACFARGECPFLAHCWSGEPDKWYILNPYLMHDQFEYRPEDYVDAAVMAREEMV